MKVFIDCRMLGSGGIGSYLGALLPFFVKQYDCTLLGNREKILNYVSENECNICSTSVSTFSIKELFFFPKRLLKLINSCDIFYTPYCNIPGGINIPICSTIHDVVFLDIKGLSGKAGTLIRKWFYQNAINKSNTVFTVSNFSKERIQAHLKIKNTKLITTYNAVPDWFSKDVNKIIQKDNSILFVGNIKKHKGLSTLIDSFNIVSKTIQDIKLVIVGNSENFRTEDDLIWKKIQNIPDNKICFTGHICDDELKSYYSKARLLIQPSFYEGFGMPPLEALILGTNVIISDIPVFKEIYSSLPVTYFKTGDASDLADKITNTYNNQVPVISDNPYSFERTFKIISDTLSQII